LTLLADDNPIGTWSLAECHIVRDGHDFRLAIDGDEALFSPEAPAALEHEISRRWPEPVEADANRAAGGSLLKWVAMGIVLILGAIVVAGLQARDRPTSGLLTSVPSTTPPVPEVFTGGVEQVTALWNEAAGDLNLNLFLLEQPGPNRLQMNLRSGLTIFATEDPATGAVRSLMIAAAPTAGEEDSDAVLASWGILIATVNPELDGLGRRQVLADLGVDPGRPLTAGLDSRTTVGRSHYHLRSGVLGGKALFSVLLAPPA
jgi:hypothetical protein